MKHLRQYIRQVLLVEAAKQFEDLHRSHYIEIKRQGETATFTLLRKGKIGRIIRDGEVIIFQDQTHNGFCSRAWVIMSSEANHGYGPLLYDIAIEWATMNGSGLTSDRASVSLDAQWVWEYYMENRGDVTSHQLDDLENTLTPEEEDNCKQFVSQAWSDQRGNAGDWTKSPLSKRYTKEPTTINKLKAAGKLMML